MRWFATLKDKWYLALFLVTALPFFLIRLPESPYPWFDEGLNLNAVRTLAETGQYGLTTSTGIRFSDPAIQTGTPIIVLLTAVYKSLGTSIGLMRLVIVILSFGALLALFGLARRLYGPFAAYLSMLLMLAEPVLDNTGQVVLMSRQVLGEMPAILLLTLALLILTRDKLSLASYVLLGLCFGLAVMIKSQILVVLPLVIGIWFFYRTIRDRRIAWHWIIVIAVLVCLYGLDTLWRSSMAGSLAASNNTILMSGARIHLFPFRAIENLTSKTTWFFLGITIVSIISIMLRRKYLPHLNPKGDSAQDAETFLMLFVGVWMLWFSLVSIGWPRYAFVGHVFSLLMLAQTGRMIWHYLNWQVSRTTYIALNGLGILSMILFQLPILRDTQGDNFYKMVNYIENNVPENAVIETWDLPAAYLLTNQHFDFPTTDVTNAYTSATFGLGGEAVRYDMQASCPDFLLYSAFMIDRDVIVIDNKSLQFQQGSYELYRLEQECNIRKNTGE